MEQVIKVSNLFNNRPVFRNYSGSGTYLDKMVPLSETDKQVLGQKRHENAGRNALVSSHVPSAEKENLLMLIIIITVQTGWTSRQQLVLLNKLGLSKFNTITTSGEIAKGWISRFHGLWH